MLLVRFFQSNQWNASEFHLASKCVHIGTLHSVSRTSSILDIFRLFPLLAMISTTKPTDKDDGGNDSNEPLKSKLSAL